jgi:hypothetical protein
MSEAPNRANGGNARAAKLSPEQRSQIASKAAKARHEILKATHGSVDHPLRIGDVEIPCYVLEDGRRVLSLGGMVKALGMSTGSAGGGDGDRLASFVAGKAISPFVSKDLASRMKSPVRFQAPTGGTAATGYEATILAELCEAVLAARQADALRSQQEHIAHQCEVLLRGFARVGIIALVDEATGYERDRAANSLAKILEAFIAQELQPWVRTFPSEYYEHMFRLRGLDYQKDTPKRPQYFGLLTNDIVYRRLAPGVLDELKRVSKGDDGRPKHKLFQKLTQNVGYPKLREHLGSVITLMKLSNNFNDFKLILDRIHPPFGNTLPLPFDSPEDDGKGL